MPVTVAVTMPPPAEPVTSVAAISCLGLRHRGLHLLHLPEHLLLVHDSSSISWASNASTKPRISAAS